MLGASFKTLFATWLRAWLMLILCCCFERDVSKVHFDIIFEEPVSLERQVSLCVSMTDKNQFDFPVIVLDWLLVKMINVKPGEYFTLATTVG